MKVAVVGGGISGLTAVWLLNEHSDHEVDLFEANEYVGGHTNTVIFKTASGASHPVDTGFIVFNKLTYPNFVKFLETLNVNYITSNMSFSVKSAVGSSGFEWSGNGIGSLFNGLSTWSDWISQFQLIWDLIRFNHLAVDVLASSEGDLSIQEYLLRHRYSDAFKRNYLLPMVSSIWSTPANETAMYFPIKTLIRFLSNHHLLQIFNQPEWLTIKNGSKTYVDKILSKLNSKSNCFNSTPIKSISINKLTKQIYLKHDENKIFGPYDQVIFASHADQSHQILLNSDCSDLLHDEIQVLSCFKFNKNVAVLHNDTSLMPRRREIWTSWNYLITDPTINPEKSKNEDLTKQMDRSAIEKTVSLTYWMNLLQSIPEMVFGPVLVTLNPPHEIDPKFVFGTWKYEHPLYTNESVKAQSKISEIQTKNGLSFIGAWTNYGFHEDGLTSALKLLILEKSHIFKINSSSSNPFHNNNVQIKNEKIIPVGSFIRFLIYLFQFYLVVFSHLFFFFNYLFSLLLLFIPKFFLNNINKKSFLNKSSNLLNKKLK